MHQLSDLAKLAHLDRIPLVNALARRISLTETHIEFLLACVVGIGAGLASVVFRWVLHGTEHFFFQVLWPWLEQISPYLLPVIPMIGAVLLIPFSLKFPGEINGYGMPRFLVKVHLKGGLIRTRTIFLKIITSAITIGTGGSSGVEGPVAQIGGGIGSSVGRFFDMGSHRLKVLIACGAAGGIAAQFNAPLAGVLFAQEIIMIGQFQLQTFGVIVISSGLATAISRAFYGANASFQALQYSFISYWEFAFYIALGLLIGFLAYVFIQIFDIVGKQFAQLKLHPQVKPILGAFLVGGLGLIHMGVMGEGRSVIDNVLNYPRDFTIGMLLVLVLLKMLATSITLGSGNVGGLFGPSLFLGAVIGGAFGQAVDLAFPDVGINPGSYALVGMGAFLAAGTHAPMTSIFLLFELTNNYQVIIPIMFASVIGVMVARALCSDSLDSLELTQKGIFLHAGREESILSNIQVEKVMIHEFESIPENMSFAEFMQIFPNSKAQYYPVLNDQGKLSGIISFQNIREILLEEGLEHLVVMKELAETELIKLLPHDSLMEAIKKFGLQDIEAIPVVSPEDEFQLVGLVKRKDVIDAYNRAVLVQAAEGH